MAVRGSLSLTLLSMALFAAVSAQNSSCPIPATFFETNRTDSSCVSDADCNSGELCCRWFSSMHCLEGLSTTPKPGMCPAAKDSENANCLMDYGGCSFDSECRGEEKCCPTPGCYYKQCTMLAPSRPSSPPSLPESSPSPLKELRFCTMIGCGGPPPIPGCKLVEDFRPNGPGCEPVCKVCRDPIVSAPVSDLVCPNYPYYFNVPLTKPVCSSDSNCFAGEKCCRWGSGMQCKKGVSTASKPGSCPALEKLDIVRCRADYVGCRQDFDCSGDHKCCDRPGCGYKQCTTPTSSIPKACTRRGCGGPPAGPDCDLVDEFRPNGLGCEPVCRVCRDPPVAAPADPVENNLTCPDYPFFFDVPLTEPICSSDADCATGEKCCLWGSGMQCRMGVNTTTKPGVCPANGGVSSENECLMDYGGCSYDSECTEGQKCCRDVICGYNSCMSPPEQPQLLTADSPLDVVVAAPDASTTAATATASSNLGCPDYPFYFDVPLTEPVCTSDSDCTTGEKCCHWGSGMQCKQGLNTTSKPGVCPANGGVSSDAECIMDYNGCLYDSECRRGKKCCRDQICGYNSCMSSRAPAGQPVLSTSTTSKPRPTKNCRLARRRKCRRIEELTSRRQCIRQRRKACRSGKTRRPRQQKAGSPA